MRESWLKRTETPRCRAIPMSSLFFRQCQEETDKLSLARPPARPSCWMAKWPPEFRMRTAGYFTAVYLACNCQKLQLATCALTNGRETAVPIKKELKARYATTGRTTHAWSTYILSFGVGSVVIRLHCHNRFSTIGQHICRPAYDSPSPSCKSDIDLCTKKDAHLARATFA